MFISRFSCGVVIHFQCILPPFFPPCQLHLQFSLNFFSALNWRESKKKGYNYFYWNVSEPITDFETGLMKKQLNYLLSRREPHLYGRTRWWSILERLCFTCCSANLQLLLSSPLTYSVQPLEGNVSNAFNLSQVPWRRQTTQREMTKSQTVQIRRVRCLLICTVWRNQAVTFGKKTSIFFIFALVSEICDRILVFFFPTVQFYVTNETVSAV